MTVYTSTKDHLVAALGVVFAEARSMDRSKMTMREAGKVLDFENAISVVMNDDVLMIRIAELLDSATRIECVKTGGDVRCVHGGSAYWAHGDVFRAGTVLFVRASYWEHGAPLYADGRHDFVFHDWSDWIEHDGVAKLRLVVAQPGHWQRRV